jgi:Spy/CpxP family protein refolding chaperone
MLKGLQETGSLAGACLLVGVMGFGGTARVLQADQRPASPTPGQPSMQGSGRSTTPPGFPQWEWWNDESVKKELGLSEDKVKKLDSIYQDRVKLLTPFVEDYTKQKEALDKMTAERSADEATYALQVSRVEQLRSRLFESRTTMLYRMYRTLQPDQYQKLRDIFDRRSARGGRGGDRHF